MLLDLQELISKYDMSIGGVVHLGAHTGEEALLYQDARIYRVVWVEGNPDLIPVLQQNVSGYSEHVVVRAIVADTRRPITLNIANETQCSSIYELGNQKIFAPETEYIARETTLSSTLDQLAITHGFLGQGYNFLNMDLQGGELLALRGGRNYLNDVRYIYTEVNSEYTYLDEPLIDDLDAYLVAFDRVETSMTDQGWGDALYVRKKL